MITGDSHTQTPPSFEQQTGSAERLFVIPEATIDPTTARNLLAEALNLPHGLYEDSFAARGKFLEAIDPLKDLIVKSELGDSLLDLKSGELIVLKVSGLPVDPNLPPTPADGGTPLGKQTLVSESMALAIGEFLGAPTAILGEKKEALVHQIAPIQGREYTQSNEGSVPLNWHQDLAPIPDLPTLPYDRNMPDWLILTGVRNSTVGTRTFIASVEVAAEQLRPTTREILGQKRFTTDPPESFRKESAYEPNMQPIHPVFSEHEGHLEAAFDTSSGLRPADPDDTEASLAIAEFNVALTRTRQEIVIEPGTAVIFNNRRVIHGRSAIGRERNPDERRWIQRVYVMDLERLVKSSMGKPWSIVGGGGYLAISAAAYTDRLLDLGGIPHSPSSNK